MADWNSQERTEQPTQARREEARRQGQIPRSRDLTVAVSLLAGFAGLHCSGPWLLERARDTVLFFIGQMSSASETLTAGNLGSLAAAGCASLALGLLPLSIFTCGAFTAASVLQAGLLVRPESVQPDLARLSIHEGIRRLFSVRSLSRGLFAGLKLLAVAAAAAWLLLGAWDLFMGPIGEVLRKSAGSAADLKPWHDWCRGLSDVGLKISLVLVALGCLEYLFERWQHERDLRMTRSEIEEETLRLEGHREYKSRRRKEGAALFSKKAKEG